MEAAGDMVPMTGDSLLRKHPQSAEKEERIVAAIIHFLSSESDHFHSLLHFGCIGSEITNSLSLYAENSKLSITKINAKPKATFSSWLYLGHSFPLTYQVDRQYQKWPQCDRILIILHIIKLFYRKRYNSCQTLKNCCSIFDFLVRQPLNPKMILISKS